MKWHVVLICFFVGALIAFGIALRRQNLAIQELGAMVHDVHTIEYDYRETHFEFISRPGESFPDLVVRAERHVFGGQPMTDADFCWESDCTTAGGVPYHVKFCAPSQAALDAAVASYCATHNCEECDR